MTGHLLGRVGSLGSTRAAWTPFARAAGGEVIDQPAALESGGWKGSLEVCAPVRRWLLTLDTLRDGSSTTTRLRCAVAPRRDFHFALLPQSRVIRALTSPRVGGFLLSLGIRAGSQAPGEEARRRGLEAFSFMVGPPIEVGDSEFDRAFLLKSDDESCARDLVGALRPQLLALHTPGSWWQLTLTASAAERTGLLEFRENGLVRDAARLEAAREMLATMLERLSAEGIIAEAAPASNP